MFHCSQAEINRQVAHRLGESVQEITRRGFSLCRVLDEDTEPWFAGRDVRQTHVSE